MTPATGIERRLVLCADDYALAPEIDRGVCALASARRLSATSCMTLSPHWERSAGALTPYTDRIAIGLHYNLTESYGGKVLAWPLERLIAMAYARLIDGNALAGALERQLDAFERYLGRAPDYVDGHQHVHQLPVVRDILLNVLARRYGARMPFIRTTVPPPGLVRGKAAVIALLGGWALRRRLDALGVSHNDGFVGVYGFDVPTQAAYGAHVGPWLAKARDGSMMMCHPAEDLVEGDAIARARVLEWSYLMSSEFTAQLRHEAVHVARGLVFAADRGTRP